MADPYIGEIRMFAGTFAPVNWLLCDGSHLPISQYTTLYSVIGSIYGGDDRTYFQVPDLRGRAPVGAGTAPGLIPWSFGQYGGMEEVTLAQEHMPVHTHTVDAGLNPSLKATKKKGKIADPAASALLAAGDNLETTPDHSLENYISAPGEGETAALKGGSVQAAITIDASGGSVAHENMQPWLAVNYIICWEGVYPPRT